MIDIRQLQVFLAVWEHRSFSKAAKAIFLTQPTVSGHIKTLEESLGVRLFDRAGKQVLPTKAGEILYPYARRMLELSKEIVTEIDIFKGADTGTVRLAGSNIPGQYILPALIGEFKQKKPKIEVELRIGDSQAVTEMVIERKIDMGMVGAVFESENLTFQPTFKDQLVLISPPEEKLSRGESVKIDKLQRLPFIFREHGSGTRLVTERALKEIGIEPSRLKIVAEMGSTEAVKQAVKAGMGCAIVSERAVRDEVEHGLLRQYSIEGLGLERLFYMVCDKQRTLSPTCNSLQQFILNKAKEERKKTHGI